MRALQRQHIVDVFVLVDDCLPKQTKPGAHSVLTDSELLTILIWDGLTEPHKNLSAVYAWVEREYGDVACHLAQQDRRLRWCGAGGLAGHRNIHLIITWVAASP